MMHALSVLAAAEAEHESSKALFYIFGGLFAVWAVALAAMGMSRATFPPTEAAGRAVAALSVLLMVGAMATAVITA
jgi:hypothetical protein